MTIIVSTTRTIVSTETLTAAGDSGSQAALFSPFNVAVYSWALVAAVFLPTIFAVLVGAVDVFRRRSLDAGRSYKEKSDATIEKDFKDLMKQSWFLSPLNLQDYFKYYFVLYIYIYIYVRYILRRLWIILIFNKTARWNQEPNLEYFVRFDVILYILTVK